MKTLFTLIILLTTLFSYELYDKTKIYKDGITRYYKATNLPINGEFRSFYKNGKLKEKLLFKNGKYHTKQFIYYDNGNIMLESTFKNGLYHGATKEYYRDGKLKRKITYRKSKLHGIMDIYNTKSELIYKILFNKNKVNSGFHNGKSLTKEEKEEITKNPMFELK